MSKNPRGIWTRFDKNDSDGCGIIGRYWHQGVNEIWHTPFKSLAQHQAAHMNSCSIEFTTFEAREIKEIDPC